MTSTQKEDFSEKKKNAFSARAEYIYAYKTLGFLPQTYFYLKSLWGRGKA